MEQYLSLIKEVLKDGEKKEDRTGTGTISKFGTQRRYDLRDGFPLVTTKKTHLKSIIAELLWFIDGDTNIKYLVDNGCRIWNEWPYQNFTKHADYNNETLKEFGLKIKEDADFAKKHGNLGPVYGKQWRDFNGADQVKKLMEDLNTNKYSRRLIISAWNPSELKDMALPPCHAFIQFFVNAKDELSCQLYQRSADVFLGVPFNIASYSLMTMMIAQCAGLKVGEFIHTTGDTHIYSNHVDQVNEQIKREPKKKPTMKINPNVKSIFDFKIEDFELVDYEAWPHIKGKVAV